MHITSDLKNIVLPWSPEMLGLQTVVPHARQITVQGQDFLVLPNNQAECKIARNLGINVPAPILTRYDWRDTKPWDIQRTTAAMLTESERAYVLNTMGTGKTRSVLYAADYLLASGTVKGPILVSAPLSTLTPVWEREIFNVMANRRVRVLYGSKSKRLKLLAEDADIYIINHHGVAIIQEQLAKKGFSILVIDELAVLRNRSTDVWKAHSHVEQSLPSGSGFAWGLTGSPTPQAPTDAWAQCKLLTPATVSKTMRQFHDMTMRAITQFKSVARPEALDIVHRAMQPSVRFTLSDVMELPETVYIDKVVKLDPLARMAYERLFQKAKMVTDSGKAITAVNEGVLHGKLMQVACGYIYTDDRTVHELPHQGRLDALLEVCDEADGKIIVFCPYVHALSGVAGFLREAGYATALVHGGTPRGQRDQIFQAFQDHPTTPRIVVAQPRCMAHGLTLTSADTVIWYGPTESLETYEQANARIIRPGQTRKTRIAHLFGTSVERVTYTRLKSRAKLQGTLLEMFHTQELFY